MQQGAGEHDDVANGGAVLQRFNVHGAKGDASCTQTGGDLVRVAFSTDQHRNPPLWMALDFTADDIRDARGLGAAVRETQQFDAVLRVPGVHGGLAVAKSYGAAIAVVGLRHEARKTGVDPLHQRLNGAKIALQAPYVEAQLADAVLGQLQKRTHLRLAKSIYGLHRIADAKHAASVAFLPAGGQQTNQLQLRAGGILKFIHQYVLQTIVEAQTQIRRCRAGAERTQRRQ